MWDIIIHPPSGLSVLADTCCFSIIAQGNLFLFGERKSLTGSCWKKIKHLKQQRERMAEILTALQNQVLKSSEQISYLNITYPKNGSRVAN